MDMIGRMYKTVVVITNTPTTLGAGAKDNYSTLLTTRGALEQGSGGRSSAFAELTSNTSWRLTVRFQAALWAAVGASMKFIIDGVTYTTQSWKRKEEKRKAYIEFNLSAEQNG